MIPRIEYVQEIHQFILAQSRAYSLVILDMKNFHVVNDLYSYDTGDRVIAGFMRNLRSWLPKGIVSLRFRHGDEFLFFLPLDPAATAKLFETFREHCEATPALAMESGQLIIVSYRFAVIELIHAEKTEAMLLRAETALREIKGQGSPRG
ncbi:MAG: diguanylate cyclase domain-containing protein [Chthoniobacterales bacterium]